MAMVNKLVWNTLCVNSNQKVACLAYYNCDVNNSTDIVHQISTWRCSEKNMLPASFHFASFAASLVYENTQECLSVSVTSTLVQYLIEIKWLDHTFVHNS
jgi:hypothetical protein